MATHTLNKAITGPWTITKSGDTWIVGENGKITGASVSGIFENSGFDAATVRVDGVIEMTGAAGTGVYLASKRGEIAVSAGGRVSGDLAALWYSNNNGAVKIDNDGLLEGNYGIHVEAKAGGATIRNDGRIFAEAAGIFITGASRADIVNAGTVKGEYAIYIEGDNTTLAAEDATYIVNSGKIVETGKGAVAVYDTAVNILNKGAINGGVTLDEGDDVVNNRGGTINDDIWTGGGNDVFKMAGGTINGNIHAEGGDDVLKLAGGTLNGVLYGGAGDDVVTLSSLATVYVEYANEGNDTVKINGSYQLGGNIENLTLLGKGNHAGIGNNLSNILTGNKGDNALYGAGGGDTLSGGKGNDRLYGGEGNDQLRGDKGSDILTGGEGIDLFWFKSGYGRDTIADFSDGTDIIDISYFGLQNYQDLKDTYDVKQSGANVVITFSDTDRLVIRNCEEANLGDTDFNFIVP